MIEFPLPPMGEGLYEVELVRWHVKVGDSIKRGQTLMEVLSDKATMEVPSPFAGTLGELVGVPGTKIKVGEVVLKYESNTTATITDPPIVAEPVSPAKVVAAIVNNTRTGPQPVAAPSVRHLARKLGIDLGKVRGSGPAGRILLDDLTPFLAPPEDNGKKSSRTDTSQLDFGRPGTTFKLAGLRKKIAEKMVASKRFIPHYSYVDECNLTQIVNLRNQLKDHLYKQDRAKLTYLAFFVRAVAIALKEVPLVNSTFNEEKQEVTLHDTYNIGVAVAVPNGLIVPVIKDVDKRNLSSIAKEIERLSEEARSGYPKVDDLRGGTFTVTSVGGIGGLISTPIINHPEVGILGVGKVVKRPVYDEHEELRPADIVFLSFSFDHRIVDGAVGVAFGNVVKKHLEQPAILLVS